nr:MAG TPA: hypothetical protein [Bacteriophage sp.]
MLLCWHLSIFRYGPFNPTIHLVSISRMSA